MGLFTHSDKDIWWSSPKSLFIFSLVISIIINIIGLINVENIDTDKKTDFRLYMILSLIVLNIISYFNANTISCLYRKKCYVSSYWELFKYLFFIFGFIVWIIMLAFWAQFGADLWNKNEDELPSW